MQTIGEREPLHGDLGRFYDAIENPRKTRGELPILRDAELRAYMADVRERTLEVLDAVEIAPDAEDPLLRDGFVYEMLLAHELQHNETMLQLLQMVDGYEPVRGRPRHRAPTPARRRPGDGRGRRPASTRSAPRRAASPTTTSAPATRSSWPPSRSTEPRSPTPRIPSSWRRPAPSRRCTGSATARAAGSSTAMGRRAPVDPGAPGHPRLLGAGRRLRPLGRQAAADRAGVGGGPPAPARASARPGSGPPRTSSPTPASRPSPTAEYSEVFFGAEHKVLRGGSWATHPRRRPAQLPQLGPAAAPPDLLRPPLREGR